LFDLQKSIAKHKEIMSNIRYILRLHTQNVGFFDIIKQTGIYRATLRKHINDFKKSGLTFEEINELTDKDLEDLFQKPEERPIDATLKTLLGLFPEMAKELKRKGVNRMTLWQEYKKKYPDGYGYSRFNRYFKKWKDQPSPILHKEHKPGDKLYIDFAGDRLWLTNPQSGISQYVEIFVAILGASQLTYVEAIMSQQKEDFISACENALQFFGGVPGAIICDNLRAAVKRASRYEPGINATFADFGEHYNTAIIPARPSRPTDKAPVENAIKIIYSRIYAKLRDQKFYTLEELNKAIWGALEEHNNQLITGRPFSRRQRFNEIEKVAMQPLPVLKYEFKKQAYRTVTKNSHVCLPADKHYYSVPYQNVGKSVKVLYSSQYVEVFYNYERIAYHKRDRTPFTYTTDSTHLLPAHRYTVELASDKFLALAETIHPEVKSYIEVILKSQRHKDQAYRLCTGILGFAKKVGNDRLTKACHRASSWGIYNYRSIKKILEQGLDMCDNEDVELKMPEHDNIRGNEYYQ
jgi:transposase